MSATILAERSLVRPQSTTRWPATSGRFGNTSLKCWRARGVALDGATLDELSESVLAESVRLAVRWVEEER